MDYKTQITYICLFIFFYSTAGLDLSGGANVEGKWEIVDYPQHPESVGYELDISRDSKGGNLYHIRARVINGLNGSVQYNPSNNQWKTNSVSSTKMSGPPEDMIVERVIHRLISNIKLMQVQSENQLIIQTNRGEQIQLQRL